MLFKIHIVFRSPNTPFEASTTIHHTSIDEL
jgi:hypothetical protein